MAFRTGVIRVRLAVMALLVYGVDRNAAVGRVVVGNAGLGILARGVCVGSNDLLGSDLQLCFET